MKTRVISALLACIIFVPIFLIGGFIYDVAIYVLAMIGLKEFLSIRSSKKELPNFIHFISYIVMSLLVLSNLNSSEIIFSIDYRVIAGLFLVFLLPAVLYHDRNLYSINDAFYLIGGIFFLGTSFNLLITLRNIGFNQIAYLFLISIITDTYALLIGMLVGKHKLLEEISPKKTWEGMIGGTIVGVFVASVFYKVAIDPNISTFVLLVMTTFLSILGEFGDLAFSAIKRYFGKKDFSNIMPGHGGILDRLDSIIFVVLGYMFFITIL